MAGNATPVVITTTATTDNSIYDIFSVQQHSPHFLILTYLKIKNVFNNDYDEIVKGIIELADTQYDSQNTKSIRGKLDIKLVTLIGISEPSKMTGAAGLFLKTFFAGMDKFSRHQYFGQQFPGNYNTFSSRLRNLIAPPNAAKGNELRLRLSYTDTFVFIGLVGEKKDPSGNIIDVELFHISISRDPKYNAEGEHHNPRGKPLLKTVHLTDEDPNHNTHYFYTLDLIPINPEAKGLIIPTNVSMNVMPSARTVQAGIVAASSSQQTFATSSPNQLQAATSNSSRNVTFKGSTPQRNLGKPGGRRRTYHAKQKKRRTRRLRHF